MHVFTPNSPHFASKIAKKVHFLRFRSNQRLNYVSGVFENITNVISEVKLPYTYEGLSLNDVICDISTKIT